MKCHCQHHTEIQQEIHKETTRYIRHGLKGSAAAASKETNGKDNKDTKDKDALIPGRIDLLFVEADKISQEKITLAQRLVDTLTRVNAKLDHDLARVIYLSGEGPQEQYEVQRGYVVGVVPAAPSVGFVAAISSNTPVVSSVSTGGAGAVGLPTAGPRNPIMEKVVDSLRAASVGELPSASAAPSPSASQSGPPTKRTCHLPLYQFKYIAYREYRNSAFVHMLGGVFIILHWLFTLSFVLLYVLGYYYHYYGR